MIPNPLPWSATWLLVACMVPMVRSESGRGHLGAPRIRPSEDPGYDGDESGTRMYLTNGGPKK
jgi:hypothetical protein